MTLPPMQDRVRRGAAMVALATIAAAPAVMAQTPSIPSYIELPAPAPFDPMPGPHIIRIDATGAIEPGGEAIIANAAANWLHLPLDTFSICYQPGTGARDLAIAVKATEAVARRLKDHAAGTVVVPPGGRCWNNESSASVRGPHVYIMGAIRY